MLIFATLATNKAPRSLYLLRAFFVVTGRPVAPVDFVLLVFSAQNNSNAQMTLRYPSDSRFHSNSSLRVGADVSTTPLESLHWMWYL